MNATYKIKWERLYKPLFPHMRIVAQIRDICPGAPEKCVGVYFGFDRNLIAIAAEHKYNPGIIGHELGHWLIERMNVFAQELWEVFWYCFFKHIFVRTADGTKQ